MNDLFEEPEGATPLDPDEQEGLLLSWVTTRADLNQAEQDNIDSAAAWAFRQRNADIASVDFALELHRQMFGEVWAWAGTYRETERNIGIAPHRIGQEMAALFDDVSYWVRESTFDPDEICVRLHHRLAQIHPFPNGNGRLARLMADLLADSLGIEPFSWGGSSLQGIGELREAYIDALRAADRHDYGPIIQFARM